MKNIEFVLVDIPNLYQLFGAGVILGFSLQMVCLLISAFVHLFKGLTKESVKY